MATQRRTLAVLYNPREILLGKKLKGKFGLGFWNGYGGDIEGEETPEQAAYREILEETGITKEQLGRGLSAAGVAYFELPDGDLHEVHLFRQDSFFGVPSSTEGGKFEHRYFMRDALPFDEMFSADKLWLPEFLQGENCEWRFRYLDPSLKQCELLSKKMRDEEGKKELRMK